MLRSRIIPCLLIHNKGLVKTVQFSPEKGKYVGDPINAVKIFNEKHVDEIIVIDIDASVEDREPDYKMIQDVATECRMPLCYGGGVKTTEQVRKIISLGAEKVSISSVAIENPQLLAEMSEAVGAQSIVLVLDVAKRGLLKKEYVLFVNNGKKKTNIKLIDFLEKIKDIPYGEIMINNIDRDGMMNGFDYELSDIVRNMTEVPMTILGGAGSYEDIDRTIARYHTVGVAAGSIFVFKGKYKAVLIQYPTGDEKRKMYHLG